MKKIIIVLFIIVSCLLMQVHFTLAGEEDIVSSAEKLAGTWEKTWREIGYGVHNYGDGNGKWAAVAGKFVDGTLSYNVKKTDSLTSPYMLIISFKTLWKVNIRSPKANYRYDSFEKRLTYFKTPEDALSNVMPTDFSPDWINEGITINYAYQKGEWIFKGGNHCFTWLFNAFKKAKEIMK